MLRSSKYKKIKIAAIALAAVFVVSVVAGLAWWFGREEGPAPVDLTTAIEQLEGNELATTDETTPDSDISPTTTDNNGDEVTPTNTGETTTTTDDESDATTTTSINQDSSPESSAIAGEWTLVVADGPVDLTDSASVSFAGFRVDEVLAGGVGEFTAVGRTADLTGTLELTDTSLAAASITVNLETLQTDNSHRDRHVRRALNTSEFPTAEFTLTEPVELPDHSSYTGPVVGDLTINGITGRVTFDLEVQLVRNSLVVVGSAPVTFADYGVNTPSSPAVVSVNDHGVMEFQLFFNHQETTAQ